MDRVTQFHGVPSELGSLTDAQLRAVVSILGAPRPTSPNQDNGAPNTSSLRPKTFPTEFWGMVGEILDAGSSGA